MDGTEDMAKRRLDIIKNYIGYFVWTKKKDGKEAAGILKEITPDNQLHIVGKHRVSLVDYRLIIDFSAREDRHNNSSGGDHNI